MQAKEIVIDAAEVVLCSACCCWSLPNTTFFFTTAISVVLWENSMLLLHPFPLGVRNGDFQTHLQLTPHVLVFVYWSFLTNFEGNSLEGVLWWLCPWGLFGWFLQRGLGWIPTCKALACLVGALENLSAPGRSIQPQSSKIGRLETLPGPGSFLRVRSKQTLRLRYLWFWWKQDLNRPWYGLVML